MKHIYFDHIALKNVRCHKEMEMEFPVEKFIAITGENGKGKSTIPKSILMALYGTDDDGTRIADMVHKKVRKNLEIIFKFRITENEIEDLYRIELYQSHKKHKNSFFLFKNDIDISGKTKSETYKYIETILIPKSVFMNSVYFTQQVKDFFTALNNADQKKIFDSILSLEIWDERYKKCSDQLSEIDKVIAKSNEGIIRLESSAAEKNILLETYILDKKKKEKEIETDLIHVKDHVKMLTDQRAECEKNIKNSGFNQKDLIKVNENIFNIKSEITNLTKQVIEINDNRNSEMKKLKNSIVEKNDIKLKEDISNLHSLSDKQLIKYNNAITNASSEIHEISEKYKVDHLLSKKTEISNDISNSKQFIHKEINSLNNKYSTTELLTEKNDKIQKLNEKKNKTIVKLESIKTEGTGISNDISELKNIIDSDQKSLKNKISLCTKCGQELNATHKKKIQESIDKGQILLEELAENRRSKLSEFNLLKDEMTNYKDEIEKVESYYNKLISDQTDKAQMEKDSLSRKLNLLDGELKEEYEKIDKEINEINSIKNKEMNLIESKIAESEVSINSIESKLENDISVLTNKVLIEQNNIIVQKSEELDELFSEQIRNIQKEVNLKEEILDTFLEEQHSYEKILEYEQTQNDKIIDADAQIKIYELDIAKLENYEIDVSNIDNTRKDLKEVKKKIKNAKDLIKDDLNKIKILKFWKEAFSNTGIKSMLIDSAIPFMNRTISKELDTVSHGKFIVSFDTLSETKSGDIRDKFSVKVLNCENGSDDHKLLSGGEKRLIDLCCMKTLRGLSENLYQKKFHITLFDEALDALDDNNSSIFCKLMKQMSSDQNVTIITHKMAQNMEADEVYKL